MDPAKDVLKGSVLAERSGMTFGSADPGGRDGSREDVAFEIQVFQLGQQTQVGRDGSGEDVAFEIQSLQLRHEG